MPHILNHITRENHVLLRLNINFICILEGQGFQCSWCEHTFRVLHCVLIEAFLPLVTAMTLMAYCVVTLTWHCVTWSMQSAALAGVNALRVSWKKHSSHSTVSEEPRRVVAPPLSHLTLPANLPETQNCQCWRQRECSSCVKVWCAFCQAPIRVIALSILPLIISCYSDCALITVLKADPDSTCLAANVSTIQVL